MVDRKCGDTAPPGQTTHPPIMAMVIMMVVIAVQSVTRGLVIYLLCPWISRYLDGAAVWCGLEVTHAIGTRV